MKVAVEEPGKWERVLTVEVPAEDLSSDVEAVYRELGQSVALPGFRKGRAPRHLIRARFGRSVETEVLERALPRAYREALEKERLVPVSDPEFENVAYRESAALSFQARVKVAPRVVPAGYKGMKLRLDVEPVQEAHVEENLQAVRERHADYVPVEREAVDGDLVLADTLRLDDEGKPAGEWTRGFPVSVGDDAIVPEFAAAVRGAAAGAEREVPVQHRRAADPDAPPRVSRFRLVVREVREKRLPLLDDALARRVEAQSGERSVPFESLAALREEVRRRLALVEEARARERMAEEAAERLVDAHSFEPPDFLVDQLLEGVEARPEDVDPMIIGDRDVKTRRLRQELRPRAERRVRRALLLSAIAREEEIEVTEEDERREIARIARREGRSPEDVRRALESADALGGLRERLLEAKVVQFIVEHAEIERVAPAG